MNDLCIDFVTFHLPHLLISTTKYGDSGVNGCRAWIIDILSKLAVFLLPYEISSLFPLANADVRASVAVDDGAVFFLIVIITNNSKSFIRQYCRGHNCLYLFNLH